MCGSVLQCVSVCYSVYQCVAVCCSVEMAAQIWDDVYGIYQENRPLIYQL